MFSKAFWKDAIERAVSTAAQAVLTVMSLDGTGVIRVDVDLNTILSAAGFGALYALLKAVIALRSGNNKTASFTDAVEYKPQY